MGRVLFTLFFRESMMSSNLQNAVDRIIEVVMFENWLRFYFIVEEGDTLYIRLPEKAMEQLKKRYGRFYDLADRLNNVPISHETSMNEVCLFISGGFDGHPISDETVSRVFESGAFQMEMQLFGYWVQAHEEQLDASFLEFSEWKRLFSEWEQSDEVREYRTKLAERLVLSGSDASETVQ